MIETFRRRQVNAAGLNTEMAFTLMEKRHRESMPMYKILPNSMSLGPNLAFDHTLAIESDFIVIL